jgi:hypothetical protein
MWPSLLTACAQAAVQNELTAAHGRRRRRYAGLDETFLFQQDFLPRSSRILAGGIEHDHCP